MRESDVPASAASDAANNEQRVMGALGIPVAPPPLLRSWPPQPPPGAAAAGGCSKRPLRQPRWGS